MHGRILLQDVYASESKDSLSASLGSESRNDVLGDARLTWAPRAGAWSFDLAYQAGFDAGDAPGLAADEDALGLFPAAPPLTWWDLDDTLADGRRLSAFHKIDRLSVSYTGPHLVVRAGRQALTWGAGFVFHPMDLFDPFSPEATDTEYKPGADMLYGQYLFDDGSDLQAVIVPRPERRGGPLTSQASSFALHYRRRVGSLQTAMLVARDHGDTVAGLAVAGSLGGASWNAEVIPTFVDGQETVSALANISNARKIAGRDVTYFAEYYRNGFGLPEKRYSLDALPVDLVDRLLRGQVFDTGRDYFAAGAQLQASPLLEISPTLIANLNDASFYALIQATYSLNENLTLVAGAQLPIGPVNTEFGGVALTAGANVYFEQPKKLYIQLRQYF
ncbi:hypothetical protein [Hyphococcus luteus]|uniref:hypothetical protein n=1 Tax=Hyphococcus luteus TaxID=2058213 RepID=UPI001057095C|nr:hypothetical protein [Marinicaulis flavus]